MPQITINAPDGRTITLNAPEGATEEQIRQKVEQVKQEYVPQAAPEPAPEPQADTGAGILNPLAQGLTFGFSDELAAGLGAVAGKVLPESMGGMPSGHSVAETYRDIRNQIREETEAFREQNPKTAFAAEMAGGLATGGAGGARIAGSQAAQQLGRYGAPMAAGAIEGGLYGAGGAEELEDVPLSAAIGAGTGAVTAAAGTKVGDMFTGAGRQADKALKEATPTAEAVKSQAQALYRQADDLGVQVKPESFSDLAQDVATTLQKEGFHPKMHPKAATALGEIMEKADSGQPLSLQDIQIMRRLAGSAGQSLEPDERRVAGLMIDKIDDFVENMDAGTALSGNAEEAGALLKQARGLWRTTKKNDVLEEAVFKAQNQASGFENGIRTQLRSIINNPKKRRNFTASEIEKMQKIVSGGSDAPVDALRWLSKMSPTVSGGSNWLGSGLSSAAGFGLGGPVGAVAAPAVGYGAQRAVERRTAGLTDKLMQDVLRGGAGKSRDELIKQFMAQGMNFRDAIAAAMGAVSGGGAAGLMEY